ELEAAGVRVLRTDASARAREVSRLPGLIGLITSAGREVAADVVQGNGEKMSLLAAWAARRLDRPCVAWLHDAPLRDVASTGLQIALRASPLAAAVVPSRWMASSFRRRVGLKADVILYGIDPDATSARGHVLSDL